MQTGRPSKRARSQFGERLHAARETLGLSQAQVADLLGITQSGYASWERDIVALRPDQIQKLTEILHIPLDHLLGKEPLKQKPGGPAGKLRQVFEKASRLPRSQQNKVAEFVEAFVNQHNKAA